MFYPLSRNIYQNVFKSLFSDFITWVPAHSNNAQPPFVWFYVVNFWSKLWRKKCNLDCFVTNDSQAFPLSKQITFYTKYDKIWNILKNCNFHFTYLSVCLLQQHSTVARVILYNQYFRIILKGSVKLRLFW